MATKVKNRKLDPRTVSMQKWELSYIAGKFAVTIANVKEAKKAVGKSRRKIYHWLRENVVVC